MKVSGKQDDKMKRKIRGGWDDEEEESKPSCNKQATEKKPWGSQGINNNKSDNVESKNQETSSISNNDQAKSVNNNKENKDTTKESSKNFYPPM